MWSFENLEVLKKLEFLKLIISNLANRILEGFLWANEKTEGF